MNMETKYKLYQCRTIQPFRIACGKSIWFWFDLDMRVNRDWNLREILNSEIVIEFDMPKDWKGTLEDFQNLSYEAINLTGVNLFNAGFTFEVWEHGGKSPHLHIHNLPITHLEKDKLRLFKKLFIRKYVPEEYLKWVDYSLTGIHLLAIEYQFHWKNKYGVKELLHKFEPK